MDIILHTIGNKPELLAIVGVAAIALGIGFAQGIKFFQHKEKKTEEPIDWLGFFTSFIGK